MHDTSEILDIMDRLAHEVSIDNVGAKKYLDEFVSIYQDDAFRHSYSEISKHMEEVYLPDQRDELLSSFDKLIIESENEEYSNSIKSQ